MLVRAKLLAGFLEVEVADDGSPVKPYEVFFPPGHGLANIRDRIANLYSGEGTISIARRDGGGTSVTLRLPARFSEDRTRPLQQAGQTMS